MDSARLDIHDLARLRAEKRWGYRKLADHYGVATNSIVYFWKRWKHLVQDPS